ncbi:type II toxin-antitoxin system RelE/ParE family toxin [Thioalkalivibrio sp. ALMg9]|uniref:type II toxin-antitoxin system RelE/ParE family toxin n=1 Tax=Thioalkalivibrio sp. ALMg9 TaxID=1266912 RepID=UPI003510B17B
MRYTPWTVRVVPLAEKEIRALPPDLQARYLRLVDVIQDHGPGVLGMPHARHGGGQDLGVAAEGA